MECASGVKGGLEMWSGDLGRSLVTLSVTELYLVIGMLSFAGEREGEDCWERLASCSRVGVLNPEEVSRESVLFSMFGLNCVCRSVYSEVTIT